VTFKHLFGVVAFAWAALWLLSALAVGGVMGDSPLQLLTFIGMALVPPAALYLLFFRLLPSVFKRLKNRSAQI
jgi:hypothetical protein